MADALHDEIGEIVAGRHRRGEYPAGLEDGLDAHGRGMVAARPGPAGRRTAPRPATPTTPATFGRFRSPRHGRGGRPQSRPGPAGPLRLLFVVQRYGPEVAGGAELYCRELAARLARRGHHVEVLTSRAVSAHDWADSYPPGESEVDGVRVHRLGVARPRDGAEFESATVRVLWGGTVAPLAEQEAWRRLQGPDLPELVPWLSGTARDFDVVVHFCYLYATTWAGLPISSALAPTVLHATAHDEPAFWLPVFDDLFALPMRYAWSTEEERDLLVRRGAPRSGSVIGVGVDLDVRGDGRRFRARFGLGERPYVLFVGRVEAGKGSHELVEFFGAYKERHPGPLALVLVGPVDDPPARPDVVCTGFVDDGVRADALAGALALVQPSFFESFSMVLTESWAQRRPVLVQGHTDVLVGQVRRSGGGLYYRGFAEFEAALELLEVRAALADELGERGRAYAEREYPWDAVLDRYEHLLRRAAGERVAG